MRGLLILALVVTAEAPLLAHPGGLAADGCHNDRRNGGRHCHGGGSASAARRPLGLVSTSRGRGAFVNCDAARAAGAAPVRRGDPGYGPHLDSDHDGIGCEWR
ncbi:MAG TPA: excalibur calcium-binding domain-containing protein [Allosphingosinicella sp.]|nr:excalibur calcium-binding domain-containing protein [Allosphingosinicella sp.]